MKAFNPSITHQKGVGLIEILISMLIGLFIMAGVLQMFSTTSQNSVATAGSSRIQENVRYAFSRIADDIAQTGNLGCFSSAVSSQVNQDLYGNPVRNMLGIGNGFNQLYDFFNIIGGYDNSSEDPNIASDMADGSDTLMVRYASLEAKIPVVSIEQNSVTVDATDADFGNLNQNQVVVVSDCSDAAIFVISNAPDSSTGLILHGTSSDTSSQHNVLTTTELDTGFSRDKMVKRSPFYLYSGKTGAYQYFIGTSASAGSNSCDITSGREYCSLYRRVDGQNLELVEGVHNLQVEYGRTDGAGTLVFYSATALSAADSASDDDLWAEVDRVRVTMQFNSIENAVRSASSGAGNTLDGLLAKEVVRTINLPNQL